MPAAPRTVHPLLLALVLTLAACQPGERVQVVREVPEYAIQEFLGTINYSGASFSPDNSKILVSNNSSGIFNVYSIPASGGEPTQLTHSTDDSYRSRGYFPADERFLFTADQGGNELNHLYVRELDGAETDLTPGENLKAQFSGWADDDKTFYISTNERDQRFFDLYEYDSYNYQRELVFQNDQAFSFGDISADRRWVALHKYNTNADSDAFLFDRETEELTHVTPHEGAINFRPSHFTPDGSGLVLITDQESEYTHALVHDLATGERRMLAEADWDVDFANHSKRGKYLVVSVNNDARTELQVFANASGSRLDLPEVPNANITSLRISSDEKHLAFYASSSRMPSDLFVQELPDGKPRRLTHSINPNIDPENLVEAEVVRFNSFDGVEIPGILYRPHNSSPDNPAPALLWVHGGPGGQSRVGYNGLIQYMVNHGYVIYAINNRGSSGYGKTFNHLDDQRHGIDDLEDCVVSKQMLIDTGFVDPRRIGILGGSYGGYMVLAALTFRPEEFAVGIDLFGISNWQRTLSNIPPWWEAFRAALEKEMGPFDDMEFFRKKSPLFFAENIVRPLMVLQGANDPRVLKEESDDIVAAAEANGVPVEYVLFEDEGHGFAKNENRERGYAAILAFANEYLRPIGQGMDG
jgi:dipeptidyl aminopeptidase/acylaminoacyl peptidase